MPVNGDTVLIGIDTSSTAVPTLNFTSTLTSPGIASLKIDATALSGITFNQTGSTSAMFATTEIVGDTIVGNTYTQAAGTNTATSLTLGNTSTGAGTYNLSGTSSLTATTFIIGNAGVGTMTQSGGTVTASQLTLAAVIGANGTYNLSAGNLTVGSLASPGAMTIGLADTGNMTQSGGNVSIANTAATSGLFVGNGGVGSYTLNSTTSNASLSTARETIGTTSDGTFTQLGNTTNTISTLLTIGTGTGGTATYNISAGTLTAAAAVLGSAGGFGTVIQSGTANVTFQAGGLVVASGGTGSYNLNGGSLTTPSTSGGLTVNIGGAFNQSAGTFNGYLLNSGNVTFSGGTFNGTLENTADGSLDANASLLATGAVINRGDISIPTHGAVGTSNASLSLDNENTIELSGGSLAGAGPILNNGSISGFGIITGTAGFTNNGTINQSGGTFIFSNTGAVNNNGAVSLISGSQFQIAAGTFNNNASFALNGALINGTGTLNNAAAGVLVGPGTIIAPIQNSGIIEPGTGTLNITTPWTNAGLVLLTGPASALVGGTITNNSTIQGVGSVANPINNNGIIEALGGTLSIPSAITNTATGTLTASSNNKLLLFTGLATNAGLISLTGGTFDNNGHNLTNTGSITGYGILRAGNLTNSGSITFTGTNGSTTTVNANITNNVGQTINIKFNPAIFTGNITNNGTIKTTGTTVTFTGTYTGNNFISDPATNIFQNNVTITTGGQMTGSTGDVFNFSGGAVTNNGAFINGGTIASSDNVTNNGNFTQTGTQNWAPGTSFTNAAGTALFGSDVNGNLAINATAGNVTLASTQHLAGLSISSGAKVTASAAGHTAILTPTLSVAGQLELNTNVLIMEATSTSDKAAKIANLSALTKLGPTTGITSATANADPTNYGVGVFDNAIAGFSSVAGQPVDSNSVFVSYAHFGDANDDGHVDLNDLNTVLNNLGTAHSDWTHGNFDGQPTIDLNDLNDILNNLGITVPSAANSVAFAESLLSATPAPEPTSLAILTLTLPALLSRKIRRPIH